MSRLLISSKTPVVDKSSPLLLGLLEEGYDETYFKNRNKKVMKHFNSKLKDISVKLNLSQPLNLGAARDCYANTLDKNNMDIKKISQMLGHSKA